MLKGYSSSVLISINYNLLYQPYQLLHNTKADYNFYYWYVIL